MGSDGSVGTYVGLAAQQRYGAVPKKPGEGSGVNGRGMYERGMYERGMYERGMYERGMYERGVGGQCAISRNGASRAGMVGRIQRADK